MTQTQTRILHLVDENVLEILPIKTRATITGSRVWTRLSKTMCRRPYNNMVPGYIYAGFGFGWVVGWFVGLMQYTSKYLFWRQYMQESREINIYSKCWLLNEQHQINPRRSLFSVSGNTRQSSQTNSRSIHQQQTAASPAAATTHTQQHRADTIQLALYRALCSLVQHSEELQALRSAVSLVS